MSTKNGDAQRIFDSIRCRNGNFGVDCSESCVERIKGHFGLVFGTYKASPAKDRTPIQTILPQLATTEFTADRYSQSFVEKLRKTETELSEDDFLDLLTLARYRRVPYARSAMLKVLSIDKRIDRQNEDFFDAMQLCLPTRKAEDKQDDIATVGHILQSAAETIDTESLVRSSAHVLALTLICDDTISNNGLFNACQM